MPFMIDSMLRHCANRYIEGRSALSNIGHQIIHVKITGIIRSSPYSPQQQGMGKLKLYLPCKILGFCSEVAEVCVLLGYDVASLCNWFSIF